MSRKFLIGQLACYGDCLFATTIAKQIKNDYHNSHITWAIASRYKSILNLNPHVDEVWELPIENGDYYGLSWQQFETEALEKQKKGIFDEIIFSQIPPLNWKNYNGTIRSTILSAYKNKITVSKEPVIILSEKEKNNVFEFAKNNNLSEFKNVILFECAPGSFQSNLNINFALFVTQKIVEKYANTCFILTTAQKINTTTKNIIDASCLTFRENAALLNYCDLLIGCSSGITWLNTSTASKKINTIQLLQKNASIFAGVYYDLEVNNLNYNYVMEVLDFDEKKTVEMIIFYVENSFEKTKSKYHQVVKPSFKYFKKILRILIDQNCSLKELKNSINKHKANNINYNKNNLGLFYYLYIYRTKYKLTKSKTYNK